MATWALVLFLVCCQTAAGQLAVSVIQSANDTECVDISSAEVSSGPVSRNCTTIGHAIEASNRYITLVTTGKVFISISVDYSHDFNTTWTNATHLVAIPHIPTSIDISGLVTPTVITCTLINTGIAISNLSNVTIIGIEWINCGVHHNTTAYFAWLTPEGVVRAYSTLFFFNCTLVSISGCLFTSDRGSGVSIYDSTNITIDSSHFINNSITPLDRCLNESTRSTCSPQATGLYIETTSCGGFTDLDCANRTIHSGGVYNISHCNFTGNNNTGIYYGVTRRAVPTGSDHWPFGKGGGMGTFLRGVVRNFTVVIKHCTFSDNTAVRGGGADIRLYPKPDGTTLTLYDCTFTDNIAEDSGGGLRLGMVYENPVETLIPLNYIYIQLCSFSSNYAHKWGGGMSAYSSASTHEIFSFVMTECKWEYNLARTSAPALGLTSWDTLLEARNVATVIPECYNCSFSYNHIELVTSHSRPSGYGAVFLQGMPMKFRGNTIFHANTESALCVSATSVEFFDDVTFTDNAALSGGGIYLLGTSWIVLHPYLNMLFRNNSAFQDGGAIFYTYPPSLSLWDFRNCFLQYSNSSTAFLDWEVTVTFVDNHAFQNGDDVYISDPTECNNITSNTSNPFDVNSPNSPFHYPNHSISSVSTPPQHMNFEFLHLENYTTGDNETTYTWYVYRIMPGATFNISMTITDSFKHSTTAVVNTACHSVSNYIQYDFQHDLCGEDGPFSVLGLAKEFTIEGSLTGIRIHGPPNRHFLLVLETDGLQPVVIPLLVNLTDCKFGFVLNTTSYVSRNSSCVCFTELAKSENVLCIEQDNVVMPCIRRGYWFGDIGRKVNNSTVYGIQTCTYGTCDMKCENCGYLPEEEWCKLPTDESDFCKGHKTGPLCSQCNGTYSLTYDAHSCTQCTTGKIVGLVIIIVIYWAYILIQLVAIVKLNFRIGSGYLYVFLYYFSVVKYIIWYNLPSYLEGLLNFFGTFARLDPLLYVYTNLCLYQGVTVIQYETLHYAHPVIILLLIFGLIGLGRLCPRFAIFSGNYAIQALCYILLLAYTTLAETSLNILNPMSYPTTYPNIDEKQFVQLQPQTLYGDHKEHLPYAIIAITLEVLIVLPFAFFLLFAPLLSRWLNLVKIKPILDEYQSCYKDRYRWFAGVYLIGRQLFFLTSIWAIHLDVSLLLNQIFCVAILLLHATIHPYHSKWLNYVDTFFLANLTLLTLLYSSSGVSALHWNSKVRDVIVTILILLPCLYFIFGAVLIFMQNVRRSYSRRMLTRRTTVVNPNFTSSATASISITAEPSDDDNEFPPRLLEEESQYRSLSRPPASDETQPLLAGATPGNQEAASPSWYQRINARISAHFNPTTNDSNSSD